MKIDKTVIKETKYIAASVVIFSVVMQAIYLCLARWNYTVLLGNAWGAVLAIANFFLMGLFVQKAVAQNETEARKTIKLSQTVRFMALILFLVIGFIIPVFNKLSLAIPLLFPSFAVYIRPLIDKIKNK